MDESESQGASEKKVEPGDDMIVTPDGMMVPKLQWVSDLGFTYYIGFRVHTWLGLGSARFREFSGETRVAVAAAHNNKSSAAAAAAAAAAAVVVRQPKEKKDCVSVINKILRVLYIYIYSLIYMGVYGWGCGI